MSESRTISTLPSATINLSCIKSPAASSNSPLPPSSKILSSTMTGFSSNESALGMSGVSSSDFNTFLILSKNPIVSPKKLQLINGI
ncbi:hypothetical protein [Methanobrevibacter sp.]|uniref:hypothetical protein n=1 Tax=Methanobrevibacter sp. TaxID=66852 RepID=UPI00386D73F6